MNDSVTIRIALAQVDTTVGAIPANVELVREYVSAARDAGSHLVVFPEQTIGGYPAEDLWMKRHFLEDGEAALTELAGEVTGIAALVGFAEPGSDGAVHNSAALLADGAIQAVYRKILLPNYGVFDERRYFEPGDDPAVVELNGVGVGLTICEDIWFPGRPAADEARAGASLVVNPSASPYHRGKGAHREAMLAERAAETGAAFALCNLVGGQDELVFDGHSLVVDADGRVAARGAAVRAGARDLRPRAPAPSQPRRPGGAHARERRGLPRPRPGAHCAGAGAHRGGRGLRGARHRGTRLRDQERVRGVLVAVSGGIDSALVALVAADALGPEGLTCVVMPSPHSSAETQADGRAIAANLGAELVEIPIADAMGSYETLLEAGPGDGDAAAGLAAENVQARIRGNLIMAISNRTGWLVLTTGNKSELSVGYATLYGDMAGGFAVLKDVPKTLVYRLVRHRNEAAGRELIPSSVIDRAPSAELRPDQRDDDSLPPYELLDRILEAYVETDHGRERMIADGLPADVVDEVIAMVDRAEYKRRQAPPGIKITPRAFGRDRRMPITNRYRG